MLHTKTLITGLIISMLLLCSCTHNQLNCSAVHNGEFLLRPSSGDAYSIVRSGNLQTETNITTGGVHKERVVWKNDCQYTLYRILDNGTTQDGIDSFFSNKGIDVTIAATTDSSYVFLIRMDSARKGMVLVDTMKIVRLGPKLEPAPSH